MEEQTNGADSAPPAAAASNASSLDPSTMTTAGGPPPVANHGWIQWIRQAFRASTLRAVRVLPEGPGAWTMLFLIAGLIAIITGVSRFQVVGAASFDARSWLFGSATHALLVFSVWFVLNAARKHATRDSPVAAWYLLFYIATLPVTLVGLAIGALVTRELMPQWWFEGHWFAWVIYAALYGWSLVTAWRVSQAVTRSRWAIAGVLLCVFVVQMLGSWQLATQSWVSTEPYEDDEEFASLELSQEVFESQQALLEDALQAITPSSGNERQAFGLVYAPYSEDVFLRESAMVKDVLETRFGARGHVVRLLNNPATTAEIPWATPLNLERSLKALAAAMDAERDVLVVYLTSHGGADFKLAAEHWPLEVAELTASELRAILDELGVRNRVIAVSACYSGGWIEPLRGDDTLVMTAADKDHTSYGCGSKSDLTFFARAVFDEQLRETLSFEDAFNAAVPVIKQREIDAKKSDGFSNPQIAVGKNIRAVLDELTKREVPQVSQRD